MAVDEYFLNRAENHEINGVLRFYSWSKKTISIGYFFKTKHLKLNKIKKDDIALVRRLTGGNTVHHENDFTYSFIIKKGFKNIDNKKAYYIFIAKILKDALANLNIISHINTEVNITENNYSCFESVSEFEITSKSGKKLIGSAQNILKNSLLQHGSFFYSDNYKKILKYIKKSPVNNNQIDIKNILDYNEIYERFKKSFSENLDLQEYVLSAEELKSINRLITEKYQTDEWTFRK